MHIGVMRLKSPICYALDLSYDNSHWLKLCKWDV